MTPSPPPDAPTASKNNTVTIVVVIAAVCVVGLLICGGIMAAIFLPAVSMYRDTTRRVVDAANTRSIVQAMRVYATVNNDVFPPHPGLLIDDGSIAPDLLDSPLTADEPFINYTGAMPPVNTNHKFGEYFFVYNYEHGVLAPPDEIIMFGPSVNGAGRSVAFGDMDCEFMPEAEFERLVRDRNVARRGDPRLGVPIDLDALGAR